jgi:hypothetical protein
MGDLLYLEELEKAVRKYDGIIDEYKKLEDTITEIKNGVREWLKINELEEFMISVNGKHYKMNLSPQSRKSTNYDYLLEVLTNEQFEQAVTYTESERLTFGPVRAKTGKNGKSTKPPKAPIAR